MVHLETLERMRKHFGENLEEYVRNHSGQFVLIEGCSLNQLTVTFYRTQEELRVATKKYEGLYGPTFLVEQIPTQIKTKTREEEFLERLIELTGLSL